jgi:hypothetical protein
VLGFVAGASYNCLDIGVTRLVIESLSRGSFESVVASKVWKTVQLSSAEIVSTIELPCGIKTLQ